MYLGRDCECTRANARIALNIDTQLLFFYEIFANECEKFRLLVFLMASVDSVYKILFFLLLFGWKVHFYYDNGLMFSHSFKFRGILPIDNLRLRWISWASAVAILLRFPFLWHVSIQYRCKGKIGTHGAKNDAAETCWIWFECFFLLHRLF